MGILTTIRAAAVDALEASDLFEGIDVLSEDKGVIANEVLRTLKQIGLLCVVMTPSAGGVSTDTRAPYLENIRVVIQIGENAGVRTTGTRALDLAEAALSVLNGLLMPPYFEGFVPVAPAISPSPIPQGLAGLTSLYQVNFSVRAMLTLSPAHPTVATPTINASNAAAVTLACATGGAAIWYTTNGTRPTPSAGTRYTGAFAATSGATVKARAGLWGSRPSAIASATVA
jgi:hypothetical protein